MPTSAPSASGDGRAVYVYAVAPAGEARVSGDVAGVDHRFPVYAIEQDALAAIVSEVALDEFGSKPLDENIRRPEWLEEKAIAHERVVGGALEADALLPMRFGTIFASTEHVREMLAREQSSFTDLLHRVRGKREWGVKGFVSRTRLRSWMEGSRPEVAELTAEVAGTVGGRSYFTRKKLERLLDDEVSRTSTECAEEAHRRLAALASDARANPPHPHDVSGRDDDMLLNGAYLVARSDEAAFRRTVAQLSDEYADLGVAFELTGPWPAYNFVRFPTGGA